MSDTLRALAYTLYRAVRRKSAGLGDFWSDFAYGQPPFAPQLREPVMWAGISMFSDLAHAAMKARAYSQGLFLAEVTIPDGAHVVVRQTSRDPRHYSVMGTPAMLISLVTQVTPV